MANARQRSLSLQVLSTVPLHYDRTLSAASRHQRLSFRSRDRPRRTSGSCQCVETVQEHSLLFLSSSLPSRRSGSGAGLLLLRSAGGRSNQPIGASEQHGDTRYDSATAVQKNRSCNSVPCASEAGWLCGRRALMFQPRDKHVERSVVSRSITIWGQNHGTKPP